MSRVGVLGEAQHPFVARTGKHLFLFLFLFFLNFGNDGRLYLNLFNGCDRQWSRLLLLLLDALPRMGQFGDLLRLVRRNPCHQQQADQHQSSTCSSNSVPPVSYASTLHGLQDARKSRTHSSQSIPKSPQPHFENMDVTRNRMKPFSTPFSKG